MLNEFKERISIIYLSIEYPHLGEEKRAEVGATSWVQVNVCPYLCVYYSLGMTRFVIF